MVPGPRPRVQSSTETSGPRPHLGDAQSSVHGLGSGSLQLGIMGDGNCRGLGFRLRVSSMGFRGSGFNCRTKPRPSPQRPLSKERGQTIKAGGHRDTQPCIHWGVASGLLNLSMNRSLHRNYGGNVKASQSATEFNKLDGSHSGCRVKPSARGLGVECWRSRVCHATAHRRDWSVPPGHKSPGTNIHRIHQ